MKSFLSKFQVASLFVTFPILASATPAAADTRVTALCNDPSNLCSVEPSKYLGDWYEIGRTAIIGATFEANLSCVKANYALASPNTIKVTNSGFNTRTDRPDTIVGTAKIENNAELTVSFGGDSLGGRVSEFFQGLGGPNYKIQNVWVDANGSYQRALVVYSVFGVQFIWILSRTPTLSNEDVDETLDYVRAAGYFPEWQGWSLTPCTDAQRAALPPTAQ